MKDARRHCKSPDIRRRKQVTALVLVGVVAGMVGLAFASVPLYRLFCQITGFGGTPRIETAAAGGAGGQEITVRFDSNVNGDLPWRFRPVQRTMTVTLGESALAHYEAVNEGDTPVVGTATFNVTPYKAAPYFVKIDCFCFTEQRLAAGQTASMPVTFYVDPAILDDPNAREVRAITLSYTFFRDGEAETKAEKTAAGAARPKAEG